MQDSRGTEKAIVFTGASDGQIPCLKDPPGALVLHVEIDDDHACCEDAGADDEFEDHGLPFWEGVTCDLSSDNFWWWWGYQDVCIPFFCSDEENKI